MGAKGSIERFEKQVTGRVGGRGRRQSTMMLACSSTFGPKKKSGGVAEFPRHVRVRAPFEARSDALGRVEAIRSVRDALGRMEAICAASSVAAYGLRGGARWIAALDHSAPVGCSEDGGTCAEPYGQAGAHRVMPASRDWR